MIKAFAMATKFYTTGEAAREAGVSRQTLQTWMAEGKIKAPGIIGSTRIWSELEVAELRLIEHRGKGRKRKSRKKVST
jgi:excisionase family DNA binding protein